jgi:hypothetical protein
VNQYWLNRDSYISHVEVTYGVAKVWGSGEVGLDIYYCYYYSNFGVATVFLFPVDLLFFIFLET